jgi:hypothetical protein
MSLPPGKKPLREIEQQADAAARVIDLTILLDFALASLDPKTIDRPLAPSDRIKRHSEWFASLKDLMFAVGVRNDLVHAKSAAARTPTAAEIKRAAKILRAGLLEALPHVDGELARAIVEDSHADQDRSRRAKPKPRKATAGSRAASPAAAGESVDRTRLFVGLGLLVLAILVLPPLVRRFLHGSEAAAEPSRRAALAALERWAPAKDIPGLDRVVAELEADVASGNRYWARMEYDAAARRYEAARFRVPELEVIRSRRDAAAAERAAAEDAKANATRVRAAEEAGTEWNHALSRFAAGVAEFEAGKREFGIAEFRGARTAFDAAANVALDARAARVRAALDSAEELHAAGDECGALEEWAKAAREGDVTGRERFDAFAPRLPEYWTKLAVAARSDEDSPLPDRLRATIALAERDAAAPQELTARRLLAAASQDALRLSDPRIASDFLLSIARAQVLRIDGEGAADALRSAADALSVVPRDPETVLRYAQLAAVASRLGDQAARETFLRTALETVQEARTLSGLPEAIYLADSGKFDEALARALSLRDRPELRDYALIALSWVAWRAAEDHDEETHRKAMLAATETGLEGASPRGAITLLQFVRSQAALGRVAEADDLRKRIEDKAARAAADFALAELRAARDEVDVARRLFTDVEHPSSPFGSAAAAAIAAAMARMPGGSAFQVLRFAESLALADVRCAALGGAAQEYARLAND